MRAYKREDFIKLPPKTIYSRVDRESGELMQGLYCKVDGSDIDWFEQDLIGEIKTPEGLIDWSEIYDYKENARDTFQEFELDLNHTCRDGSFDHSDVFVVWDKKDISKLIDCLTEAIK